METIKKMMENNLVCSIGEVNILPRQDDLPEHYIKGETKEESEKRIEAIVNMKTFVSHDHSSCDKKMFVRINDKKIVLDIICQKARYILKRKDSKNFYLITAFKLRKRQCDKSCNLSQNVTITDFSYFNIVISSLVE